MSCNNLSINKCLTVSLFYLVLPTTLKLVQLGVFSFLLQFMVNNDIDRPLHQKMANEIEFHIDVAQADNFKAH